MSVEKSLIILAPCVNVIKLFSSLLMKRPNKLECSYLAIPFQSSLTFAGNTSGLYYKQVTIVVYDHNDSGQYYKTTITIVIDERQLRL